MSARANRAHEPHWKTHKAQDRPPFQCIALLLQGGGALGAYQAGVYQGLSEAHLQPDWVAGISIGAVNSALIAGNPPETRLEKLRAFWELVTTPPFWADGGPFAAKSWPVRELYEAISAGLRPFDLGLFAPRGDAARGLENQMNASMALTRGANGMFVARIPPPWLQPAGALEATAYYDSTPLKATLERLVDFDRINDGDTRFSVGGVNVGTGNFVYFDNATHTIGPEHVMASGALPPGFPAVEIEGEYYWDGGLVSNTPLQWVLESEPRQDTLAFQVDLWSARGALPRDMAEVVTRQKEIQYSSRTRANSDRFKQGQKIRHTLSKLLSEVPDEVRNNPEYAELNEIADHKVYNLIQLIYRSKQYEGNSKDYEFSRRSMEEHWRSGYHDTVRTLRHPEVLERPKNLEGVLTFDLAQDGRE
jgi:NTE family protein